jgi:flavin reductase (DIM6/NTAB) family NADH-FMN oxidoreductase RutF
VTESSHREHSQVFYETNENKHGLRHDPFKAIVGPRPIGWIATVSRDGICNIGPYSFFNAVGEKPHFVMFSSSGRKDSLKNAEETGEFTCSLATWDLRFNMNMTSASVPYGVDEFPIGELTAVPGRLVKAPRVKESPAALECKFWKTVALPSLKEGDTTRNWVVFGQVVGVYIDDRFVKDGMVDTGAMQPIGRLGYMDYSVVSQQSIFAINRPSVEEAMAKIGVKAAE